MLLIVGALGLLLVDATGVTLTVPEAAPVPALLVAVTLQLYSDPLVRLLTVIGLAVPVLVTAAEVPVTQDAVYLLMVAPPLDAGAVKATAAWAAPAVAAPMVGAPGTVTVMATGVTVAALDATLLPALLVAVTLQEYKLPLLRPVTTMGLAVPVTATAAEVPVAQDAV